MEDHEEQEVEFWAKLREEGMRRTQMLRRSIAAAAGRTGRAPTVVAVRLPAAVHGPRQGQHAEYFASDAADTRRAATDARRCLYGEYWRALSVGHNQTLGPNVPNTSADLLKSEYKGKVAIN